jgi:pimeloyl-ACP methyl ester carboxylesterase
VSDEQRSLVFLPGAAGASEFWLPVATRLPDAWRKTLLSWPGAGNQPNDPRDFWL